MIAAQTHPGFKSIIIECLDLSFSADHTQVVVNGHGSQFLDGLDNTYFCHYR